jgi:hypothetical protein
VWHTPWGECNDHALDEMRHFVLDSVTRHPGVTESTLRARFAAVIPPADLKVLLAGEWHQGACGSNLMVVLSHLRVYHQHPLCVLLLFVILLDAHGHHNADTFVSSLHSIDQHGLESIFFLFHAVHKPSLHPPTSIHPSTHPSIHPSMNQSSKATSPWMLL